jgi:3-oxoacyl-[acyl-carrier-protein] synthase II
MDRVAISGAGSINALGTGVDCFAEALRAGLSGIGELSVLPNLGFRSACAAEVADLELPRSIAAPLARRASRTTRLALIAADEAWHSAGLDPTSDADTAIVLGTTTGGIARGEEGIRRLLADESKPPPATAWLEAPVASPTDALADAFGTRGPRLTLSTACSSGAIALGLAADWIRCGRAEVVLCGGVDSLCLATYSGFDCLRALDTQPCRPFDENRAGLTLGEGAALFVLESWPRARARGVRPIAEFVSYGMTSDAFHVTQPRPDGAGAIMAMGAALDEGGLARESIDYINAHGTGTPLNDVIETRAIKAVFGSHAFRIPVSSTKSMVGHCLAASGAIEALASVIALQGQFVPPTAMLERCDPECDLDYVPRTSRSATLETVMSNSYGFGGNNSAVVLRRAEL